MMFAESHACKLRHALEPCQVVPRATASPATVACDSLRSMRGTAPALVVLAAGMGSRYRGPKQLEPVGPGGATLMDYSIYDARRAGFQRVVVVVRPDVEKAFHMFVDQRYGVGGDAIIALQRLDDAPAGATGKGREKPWGTGHAVLAAEPHVTGPFAVVNADDFYGRDAFAIAAEFLRHPIASGPPAAFANVTYSLAETLSSTGGVHRAVCRLSGDGWLETLEEIRDIRRGEDGAYVGIDPAGHPLRVGGDALVSMNLWAFTPAVFPLLRHGFAEFLRQDGAARREFLLPDEIRDAVARGRARVRVLRAKGRWLGITYAEDRTGVEAALREFVAAGEYPEHLWK